MQTITMKVGSVGLIQMFDIIDVAGADNAMGTICLFNTLAFGAFTVMFVMHRDGYIIHSADAPVTSGGASENPMQQPSTKISSSDHGSEEEPDEETF